jgi:RHS repeat-associated protein
LVLGEKRERPEKRDKYYPFGLQTANSWTRTGVTGNNFLGNGGTELNTTTSLYDLDWRNYDPVLGRLNQVDLMADKYGSLSPYHFSFNNPVGFNDPSGLDPGDIAYGKYVYGMDEFIAGDQARAVGGGGGGGDRNGFHYDANGNLYLVSGDQVSIYNGSEWVDAQSIVENREGWIQPNFTQNSNYVDRANNALTSAANLALGFMAADVAIPDPTDAAWPKWAGYAATGLIAHAILKVNEMKPPFGDPKNWVASKAQPKTLSDYENEENNFPPNNGKTNAVALILARIAAGVVLLNEFGQDAGKLIQGGIEGFQDNLNDVKSFFNDMKDKAVQGVKDVSNWP